MMKSFKIPFIPKNLFILKCTERLIVVNPDATVFVSPSVPTTCTKQQLELLRSRLMKRCWCLSGDKLRPPLSVLSIGAKKRTPLQSLLNLLSGTGYWQAYVFIRQGFFCIVCCRSTFRKKTQLDNKDGRQPLIEDRQTAVVSSPRGVSVVTVLNLSQRDMYRSLLIQAIAFLIPDT